MKLSVGYNGNRDLIERIAEVPEIYEVYGNVNMSLIGTGRAGYMMKNFKKTELPGIIACLHKRGIRFSYTINAPCLNNLEYTKKFHRQMLRQLAWIEEIGADGVIVTIPYLLELIKKHFPRLRVRISVIAQVNSVSKVRFYEDMGADEILVDYMLNRDFALLEKIRKNTRCALVLLVNDVCTYGCVYRNYHYNVTGHSSQLGNPLKGFAIEYCSLRCSLERLKKPELILSARWIRPEDLCHYENIGYDNFKISGRKMSTDWIIKAARAYAGRQYTGNLLDILEFPLPGDKDQTQPVNLAMIRKGTLGIKAHNFMQLGKLYPQKPFLDNQALDGFIDHFIKKGCPDTCSTCNYCAEYTQKALHWDEAEMRRIRQVYEEITGDLVTSRIFL